MASKRKYSLFDRLNYEVTDSVLIEVDHVWRSHIRSVYLNYSKYSAKYRSRNDIWDDLKDIDLSKESGYLVPKDEAMTIIASMLDKHSAQLPLNIRSLSVVNYDPDHSETYSSPVTIHIRLDTVSKKSKE